jgi:hypothetical protein
MRRFTNEERIALRTIGPPGEGPVSDATFDELEKLGYGFWGNEGWEVTAKGTKALELDDLARQNDSR